MRTCFTIALLLGGLRLLADGTDDANVRHAKAELGNIESLVSTGVLPRVRLRDAQNRLEDAQDEQAIRAALGKQDISVEDADAMVALTDRSDGFLRVAEEALALQVGDVQVRTVQRAA